MSTTLAQPPAQTVIDTCDRCGAASAAQVTLTTGGRLHLCGHHLRDHHGRLRELSAHIRMVPGRDSLGVPADK